MERSKGSPPSPWEDDEHGAEEQDPVKVLSDLLLGRAGKPTGAIAAREIRVSSGLVLAGVCLGLAGFGAIALAQVQDVESGTYALRELGGVLGGFGLVVLLWGILAGLPPHRAVRVVGLGGGAIGVLGLAAFVWAYPQNWGRIGAIDHTVPVIGTYVAGLVLLVAATFGALVADFVLRMQVRSRLRGELGREPTDEEIQRDIDEAMRKHKVTWGGLAADHGKGIKVKVEAVPPEWAAAMPKLGRETVATGARADAVDTAVNSLVKFRGGRNRTGELPEGGVGDAAESLAALRAARAAEPKPSWLDRILGRKRSRWAPPTGWDRRDGPRNPPGPPGGPGLGGDDEP